MQFHGAIDASIELPASLVHLTVSENGFTPGALVSLLRLITARPKQVPIVFEASALVIKPPFYAALQELAFDQCYPNIAEFNWNLNAFPSDTRYFFAFLFTQRRMRLLSLSKCTFDDPTATLKNIIQLGFHIRLQGLDFLFEDIPKPLFAQFVQALKTWTSLRRLNCAGSGSGDIGMGALLSILPDLANLNELGADGFKAESREAIAALWSAIAQIPGIVACDLPQNDAKGLGVPLNTFDQEFVEQYMAMKAKPRLTTADQRVGYTIRVLRDNQQPDVSGELFQNAARATGDAGGEDGRYDGDGGDDAGES
jgi:hypothetical protein